MPVETVHRKVVTGSMLLKLIAGSDDECRTTGFSGTDGHLNRGEGLEGIFISYRRDDSAGYAGRLYDRLVAHFGADIVFMDVEGIEPGTDFVKAIEGRSLRARY